MTVQRADLRAAALGLPDVVVLVGARPHPVRTAAHLAHPAAWCARVGTDHAVVELGAVALWLVAAWLGAGLLAAAGARLPGVLGRTFGRSARRLLPVAVARVVLGTVAGAAGIGLLCGAAGAPTAGATPGPAHPRVVAGATAPPPGPAWPTDPVTAPAPQWPQHGTAPASGDRGSNHDAPSTGTRVDTGDRRIRSGDCLWVLAGQRLGSRARDPQIAAYVERLYAANRSVIGDDPDLVRPGQVVRLPAPRPQELP